jgi:MOSC domain-containing protein YiiM
MRDVRTKGTLVSVNTSDGGVPKLSKVHPGSGRLYARVLEEGVVRVGDPVEILLTSSSP